MKLLQLLCFAHLIMFCTIAHASSNDYIQYHKSIIAAENEIFLKDNASAGLNLFKKTFTDYDFVFVDDCIEAFQLALYYKREDLATFFIKRAIDNGLELHLLDLLNCSCPCNFLADARRKVAIQQSYMATHGSTLQRYADSVYPRYLSRLDKHLIRAIWERHVKEQLFKNFHDGLILGETAGGAMAAQAKAYDAVCDDNLRFMDSLAKHGVYLGERNLGLYTLHLAEQLHLPTIDSIRLMYLSHYHLPLNTFVPINAEEDYFGINPVFNMLFHNKKSYDVVAVYSQEAIRQGYMHPREFATLLYNGRSGLKTAGDMHLIPHTPADPGSRAENTLREKYYLPSHECDSARHAFGHEHDLKLFFDSETGLNKIVFHRLCQLCWVCGIVIMSCRLAPLKFYCTLEKRPPINL